jgi:hypothetical protein
MDGIDITIIDTARWKADEEIELMGNNGSCTANFVAGYEWRNQAQKDFVSLAILNYIYLGKKPKQQVLRLGQRRMN